MTSSGSRTCLSLEAEFLENAILPLGISDRSLSRVAPAENRQLLFTVLACPIDPPLARVHSIFENQCWLDVELLHGMER